MENKYTQSPWKIAYEDGSGPEYITGNNGENAIVTLRWGCSCCKSTIDSFAELSDEEKANAYLIAAAPELLEALEDVKQWMQDESNKGKVINGLLFNVVCSTIAKANGG